MPVTSIKWSTAGDAYVNDGQGSKWLLWVSPVTHAADWPVSCNVRHPHHCGACMRLPYSQDRPKFDVNAETGIIHSEMNTPGVQMAYAGRLFLKMVNDSGKLGRVAFKPTQAMEDGINAGLLTWMLEGTKFNIGRKWAVNAYDEHKNGLIALSRFCR